MRALFFAVALFCAAATDAAAQPGRDTVNRDDVAGVQLSPPAPDVQLFQNICIGTEVTPAPRPSITATPGRYIHSFYFRDAAGDFFRIDVTGTGLRVNSATTVAPLEGSPQADTRFNTLIETLRAAAASRSRIRIDHRNSLVTQVTVAWNQRCD